MPPQSASEGSFNALQIATWRSNCCRLMGVIDDSDAGLSDSPSLSVLIRVESVRTIWSGR